MMVIMFRNPWRVGDLIFLGVLVGLASGLLATIALVVFSDFVM